MLNLPWGIWWASRLCVLPKVEVRMPPGRLLVSVRLTAQTRATNGAGRFAQGGLCSMPSTLFLGHVDTSVSIFRQATDCFNGSRCSSRGTEAWFCNGCLEKGGLVRWLRQTAAKDPDVLYWRFLPVLNTFFLWLSPAQAETMGSPVLSQPISVWMAWDLKSSKHQGGSEDTSLSPRLRNRWGPGGKISKTSFNMAAGATARLSRLGTLSVTHWPIRPDEI